MDTKKINTQEVDLSKINKQQAVKHRNKLLDKIIFIFIFVFTVLSAIRVPYVGSYIDTLVFEFLFGYAKFIIYGFLLVWSFMKIFNLHWATFFERKTLLFGVCILSLTMSVVLSCIGYEFIKIKNNFAEIFADYFDHWKSYLNNTNWSHYFNHIGGGVIGTSLFALFDTFSFVLIFIVGFFLVSFSIAQILNRPSSKVITWIKSKIILSLGGSIKRPAEMEVQKGDKDVHYISKNRILLESRLSTTPPISLIEDTSVDNFFENKRFIEKFEVKLTEYFSENHIKVNFDSISVMPLYYEISYEADSQETIQTVINMKDRIADKFSIKDYSVSYKGNLITFEIPNTAPSKVSMKTILENCKEVPKLSAVAGLDNASKPLLVDFQKTPNILIIGNSGSGATMLFSELLSSALFLNSPADMELLPIYENESIFDLFGEVPHMIKDKKLDTTNIVDYLSNILVYVKKRKSDDNKKMLLIVFTNFDKVISENFKAYSILAEILSVSQQCNTAVILTASSVNKESTNKQVYKEINCMFVLRLSTIEESQIIFESERGYHLYGNGDGYFFNDEEGGKTRFQTCYMNQREIESLMRTINTFYTNK